MSALVVLVAYLGDTSKYYCSTGTGKGKNPDQRLKLISCHSLELAF